MTCKMSDKIDDYIEGLLSNDIEDAVKKHLDSCSICNNIYKEKLFLHNILKESFSTDDIEFTSSRNNIVKSINKDKYKYNSVKKIFRNLYQRRRIYGTLIVGLVVAIIGIKSSLTYLTTEKIDVTPRVLQEKDMENSSEALEKSSIAKSAKAFSVSDSINEEYGITNFIVTIASNMVDEKNSVEVTKENGVFFVELYNGEILEDRRNLSEDFNKEISFDNNFNINFKDYNGDKKEDFLIGQKIDEENYNYIMYTLKENKIKKISFDDEFQISSYVDTTDKSGDNTYVQSSQTKEQENVVITNSIYSPDFQSNEFDTINIPTIEDGNVVTKLFVWNRKSEKFIFEKDINDDDLVKTSAKFTKVDALDIKKQKSMDWIESSDGNYLASIYKSSDQQAILIKNIEKNQEYRYKLFESSNKYNLVSIEFDEDNNIITIIGDENISEDGGDLYKLDVETGYLGILRMNVSKRQEITKVVPKDDEIICYLKVYEDETRNNYHEERYVLAKYGGMPSKVEILN